jgi:hypothetical protein
MLWMRQLPKNNAKTRAARQFAIIQKTTENARMSVRRVLLFGVASAVVACATTPRQAGECPSGTVLHEGSCIPNGDNDSRPSTPPPSDPPPTAEADAGEKTPYDKLATDAVLTRAAKQVKANCGHAKDEHGKANGPWGETKVSVTLERRGRTSATVPAPYDGTPSGKCVVNAFTNLYLPTYSAPTDSIIEWDIELVQPGKEKPEKPEK